MRRKLIHELVRCVGICSVWWGERSRVHTHIFVQLLYFHFRVAQLIWGSWSERRLAVSEGQKPFMSTVIITRPFSVRRHNKSISLRVDWTSALFGSSLLISLAFRGCERAAFRRWLGWRLFRDIEVMKVSFCRKFLSPGSIFNESSTRPDLGPYVEFDEALT